MTILGTCGVSDAEVRLLLLQGLQITANTTPFSDYLISRSDDFVVQNMDAYTPLLTEDEFRSYVDRPQRFCSDLLNNLDTFNTTCMVLIRASRNTRHLAGGDLLASALAALMIYQSALDNHYYKYDAQIEFDDSPRSPVGHHWLELQRLCLVAAQQLGISDGDRWAQTASLAALQSISGSTATREFSQTCGELGVRISVVCSIRQLPAPPSVAALRTADAELFRDIRRSAQRFRLTARELVEASLRLATVANQPAPSQAPAPAEILADVRRSLNDSQRVDFAASLRALRLFSEVQQEEAFRFKGILLPTTNRNVDAGDRWWGVLRRAVGGTGGGVPESVRDRALTLVNAGLGNGIRGLLALGPALLTTDSQETYHAEIRRWMPSPEVW
jgi:hypothetical protein